jgi:hypothetical protein
MLNDDGDELNAAMISTAFSSVLTISADTIAGVTIR